MNLRLPNITGLTQQEQLVQIRAYLYQLHGDLQWTLDTMEKNISATTQDATTIHATTAEQERQGQDNFDEVKSLIIKSADIVNAYYVEIDKLLKLSGDYVAESDFGIYKHETSAAIDASNELIRSTVERTETIKGEVDAVRTAQTEIKQIADNVSIEVSRILDTGVNYASAKKTYSFGVDGLVIIDNGSNLKTEITNDGMKVYRGATPVLVVNNEGVEAKDLSASTYLIIGGRSRFENYGENRTGCFWIA